MDWNIVISVKLPVSGRCIMLLLVRMILSVSPVHNCVDVVLPMTSC